MPLIVDELNVISVSPTVPILIQLLKLASLIDRPMQDGAADPNNIGLNELKIVLCMDWNIASSARDIIKMVAMPQMNISRAFAGLVALRWIEPAVDVVRRRRKVSD
jgi:hypothetical protein